MITLWWILFTWDRAHQLDMTLSSLSTYWFISLVVFDFNDIATADLLSPLLQATAILFLSGITLSHVIVWLALAQTYHVSPGQQHLEAVSDFFLTQLTLLHGQVLHVCNRTATAAALTGMPSCSLSHKGIAEPSSISVDISNPNIILLRYCQWAAGFCHHYPMIRLFHTSGIQFVALL